MRKISAGAALVVVPTLIAGIYGMNFDHMPELHWTYGYPFALAPDGRRGRRAVRAVQEVRVAVTRPTVAPRWRGGWCGGSASSAWPPTWSTRAPARSTARSSPRSARPAVVVGLVTGAGEAMALVLRLAFGPLADRTGRYWSLTIVGYGLTAVCVPLLALAPRLGAAGLAFASTMILLERLGKAVRSPSKSALLAHVAAAVGPWPRLRRAQGAGPGRRVRRTAGGGAAWSRSRPSGGAWRCWPSPARSRWSCSLTLRRRVPDPSVYDDSPPPAAPEHPAARRGWWADAVGAGPAGRLLPLRRRRVADDGRAGHLRHHRLPPHRRRPGARRGRPASCTPRRWRVEAVAALAVGSVYDRTGPRVLLVVPVLVALVPALALRLGMVAVLGGVVAWGFAQGVQDSTVKAVVADLVDAPRRATAYGVFAGIQGCFAIVGGVGAGWLYEPVAAGARAPSSRITQVVALVLLADTFRRSARRRRAG